MVSVRKLMISMFFSILILLIFVGVMGLTQHRLNDQYSKAINQGGKILFKFIVIKEQMYQALLARNWQKLQSSTQDIEALDSDLNTFLRNNLIPENYKIALVNQVDLPGIVLLSKRLPGEGDQQHVSVKLYEQLRVMSDQLMKFDRVLYDEMKAQLIQFQKLTIGILALIISAVTFLFFFLYLKGFAPFLDLSNKILKCQDTSSLQPAPGACREVTELTHRIKNALHNEKDRECSKDNPLISPENMNIFSNQLNGIINYAQLLIDEKKLGVSNSSNVNILEKIISSSEIISSVLQKQQMKGEL